MKALVSTIEFVKTGWRIAQVEKDKNIFPVADALFWIDCHNNTVADECFYDPITKKIVLLKTHGLQTI